MKLKIKQMALPLLVCTAVIAMMLAMTISAGASAETSELAAASEDANWRFDETVSLDNGQSPTVAVGGSTTPFNLSPWVIVAAFGGLVLLGAGVVWRRQTAS